MALGSDASRRRRAEKRRHHHLSLDAEYQRVKAESEPLFKRYVDRYGVDQGRRLLDIIIQLESLSWIAKDPPDYFKENLRRLMSGEPPMPRPRFDPDVPYHRPGKVRRRLGEKDPERAERIRERLLRRLRGR